jgi:glycine oxidase
MKIAIIGAGLMGRLTALKLISLDHEVTILEAHSFDHPHNAVAVSAGMISPISEAVHTTPEVVRMGFHSCTLWPNLLETLCEADPEHQKIHYDTNGTIAISFPEEQECLLKLKQTLQQKLPDHKTDIRMLYNDEVMAIEPELGRFETALLLNGEANICNSQFIESSNRAIRQHASIVDHWPLQGTGKELQSQYDWVIDCRGAGAVEVDSIAQEQNHSLKSVRGETIRVRTDKVNIQRPIRVIQQRFNIYIVPKPNNIFVVGATDLDKHGTHAVTVRSSLDLLSTMYALHPGFADAEIVEAIVGQRAVYDNRQPYISTHENIISVNGLSRQGWLLGPAMTENVVTALQ